MWPVFLMETIPRASEPQRLRGRCSLRHERLLTYAGPPPAAGVSSWTWCIFHDDAKVPCRHRRPSGAFTENRRSFSAAGVRWGARNLRQNGTLHNCLLLPRSPSNRQLRNRLHRGCFQLRLCQKVENSEHATSSDCITTGPVAADYPTKEPPMVAGQTDMERIRDHLVEKLKLPTHIGIIMDGNGRWGLRVRGSRSAGHEYGTQTLRRIVEDCLWLHIPFLTVFAFSTENWRRPAAEISSLLSLFQHVVDTELEKLQARSVRVSFVGDRSALPDSLRERMHDAEERTRSNRALCLQVALNYSGRQDILQAVRCVARDVERGVLDPDSVNESVFETYLAQCWGIAVPDPDLIIRTGGEQRLSNFMLWQAAYAEIYTTDILWPEFTSRDFFRALEAFHERRRQFGGLPNCENDAYSTRKVPEHPSL
jgi:undecaprenyl diphosphate synthase